MSVLELNRRSVLGGAVGVTAAVAVGATVGPPASAAPRVVVADLDDAYPIVVAANEDADVQLAADEIVEHVAAVTGHAPEIVASDPGRPAIWLGAAARDRFPELAVPGHPHGFALKAAPADIAVAGTTGRGTLYGTYELLERCGVRWLTPGPHGTVLPAERLTLDAAEASSEPHFDHRVLQGILFDDAEEWYRRQRLDHVSYGAHTIPTWPRASRTTDPELYVQVDGKPTRQLNVTLPEVLDRAEAAIRRMLESDPDIDVINLGPNDGSGFGAATDWDVPERIDPLYGELVVTDRYVRFFNLLLDRLSDHPDLNLAFYAYHLYMEPPVREKPNPRIIPVFAPIAVDRRKSISDADGWERRYVLRVIEEWKALGVDWMYRGYLGNLADPGLPFSPVRQLAAELPEYVRAGATGGIRLEAIAGWGHQGPAIYLAARLMWNPMADASAVMDEWFRHAFGPAHAAMSRYFHRLGDQIAKAPYTAGGIFDMADSLPPDVMDRLGSDLSKAVSVLERTGQTAARARLELTRRAHVFGEELLTSYRRHLVGDTAGAVSALTRARTVQDAALELSPAPLYIRGRTYLDRYHGTSVDRTAAIVASSGPPVTSLPRAWEILVDSRGGESIPGSADGTWTTTDTAHTWSAQGLRYFKGQVWYRCMLPGSDAAGRPHLFLPNVDEDCQVWLNGIAAPALTTPRSFLPMQFDLGDAWSVTGQNRLLILAINRVLDELGTGGLLGTGLVLADHSVGWTAPSVNLEGWSPPQPGPTAPPRPPGAIPVDSHWEVMLDPGHAIERLALHDRRISSQHFRDFDPAKALIDQGLGRYTGGLVVRTAVNMRRRRTLLLAVDPDVPVWVNSTPVTLSARGGGWSSAVLPEHRGRTATLAIGLPADDGLRSPLAPHWARR